MYTRKLRSPRTNRPVTALAWDLDYDEVRLLLNTKQWMSGKQIGWALLNDTQTARLAAREQYGESAGRNFALGAWETGLDYGIGLMVLAFMRTMRASRKRVAAFTVLATRRGDVFVAVTGKSGVERIFTREQMI